MKAAGRVILAGTALLIAAGLSGCGEREQVIIYKQGKYQGKPDGKPWDSDPASSLYTTSKWTPGDKTSWESAVRTRNSYQNEMTRGR